MLPAGGVKPRVVEEVLGTAQADRSAETTCPEAGQRVFDATRAAVRRLAETPDLGRPGRVDDTRELLVAHTRYIVAYAVIDNQLMVLAVLHDARQWPRQLE